RGALRVAHGRAARSIRTSRCGGLELAAHVPALFPARHSLGALVLVVVPKRTGRAPIGERSRASIDPGESDFNRRANPSDNPSGGHTSDAVGRAFFESCDVVALRTTNVPRGRLYILH